ncbi:hypothetical protein BN135_4187 [Cronobacter muytjensii 530]
MQPLVHTLYTLKKGAGARAAKSPRSVNAAARSLLRSKPDARHKPYARLADTLSGKARRAIVKADVALRRHHATRGDTGCQ